MNPNIQSMREQYEEHASFYDQHSNDALYAQEHGDWYGVEYYRELMADEWDAMASLELECERLGIDIQELL